MHDNTITATGTGLDITRTAGTVTITAFDDNVVSGASGGTGIIVSGPSVTFDATPGGAFDVVSGGTTVIGQSGNGVGGAGLVLSNVSGDLSFVDLNAVADNGAALFVAGTGAINVGAGTGTRLTAGGADLHATGGPAVSVNLATIDLQLASMSSTTATNGLVLTNVNGLFSAPSGSAITKSSGYWRGRLRRQLGGRDGGADRDLRRDRHQFVVHGQGRHHQFRRRRLDAHVHRRRHRQPGAGHRAHRQYRRDHHLLGRPDALHRCQHRVHGDRRWNDRGDRREQHRQRERRHGDRPDRRHDRRGGFTFQSTSSGGGTRNVKLTSVTGGAIALGTGALSGATGAAFLVGDGAGGASTGGTSAITYGGTITATGAARAVDIQDRSAGAGNITLSGTITHSSGNANVIFLDGNAAGTILFSGAGSVLNGGTSTAVSLTNNTGATINFTGGSLDIDATSGGGFHATGGGTVNVTGTGNTITTTTGTALNVANTTIGASGLTFREHLGQRRRERDRAQQHRNSGRSLSDGRRRRCDERLRWNDPKHHWGRHQLDEHAECVAHATERCQHRQSWSESQLRDEFHVPGRVGDQRRRWQ